MKVRLENIQKEVSQLMQERLAGGKYDQIESLTPLLTKAGKLKLQIDEIEMGIATLENALKAVQNKTQIGTDESTHINHETQQTERGDGRAAPSTIRIQ